MRRKKTNNSVEGVKSFFYSFIYNYVFIDYVCFHSRTITVISSDKIFEEASYNELLDIVISEVLMNLISCHG